MAKTIFIDSVSTPENPEVGYGDRARIVSDDRSQPVAFNCSVCPNPFKPGTDPRVTWSDAYGWLAPGRYRWECIIHPKYGKCLLINDGGECSSRTPNPNHDGEYILTQIMFHTGGFRSKNPLWRGSAGCVTAHPIAYADAMTHFKQGETGELYILDPSAKGTGGKDMGLLGKFKIGKAAVKALKAAIPAGAATAAASIALPALQEAPRVADTVTAAAEAVSAAAPAAGVDIPTTALVTVLTWLARVILDYFKHR